MSEILNTKHGTYDLSDRMSVYKYFCQNFGFKSGDISLIEKYFVTEYESLQSENKELRAALMHLFNAASCSEYCENSDQEDCICGVKASMTKARGVLNKYKKEKT